MNLIKTNLVNCYRNGHFQNTESATRVVLKNFTKFTGKDLRQSLYLNKVAGLMAATLLKKRLRQKCFPVNFVTFLTTTFFQVTVSQNVKAYI